MKGFTEFKERFTSDKAFAMKFANAENEAQVIAIAKAEGYDLEQLSDEELDEVAAGGIFGWVADGIKSVGSWTKKNLVDPMADVAKKGTRKVAETVIDVMGVDDLLKNSSSTEDFKNIHLTNNKH